MLKNAHQPFLSLILSSTLVSGALATGMLTYDAEANAHLATTNSQQTTMIGKLVDGIRKYEEMISKAQEQIAQLNKVNDLMNKANALISGSAITIANPMHLLDQFKSQIASIQANYEDLKQAVENFDIRDKLRDKYLKKECPWLDLDKLSYKTTDLSKAIIGTGAETRLVKDAKALLRTLSDDNTLSAYQNLKDEITGKSMGLMVCESLNEARDEVDMDNSFTAEAKAILKGDYTTANQERLKRAVAKFKKKIKQEQQLNEKIQPLIARLDTLKADLGVTDKNANDNKQKIQYCKENPNTHTCEPILLTKDKLSNDLDQITKQFQETLAAATSKDAQSQVFADYNQKIKGLTLAYLREITNQLLFLNKTMAMHSALVADVYKREYGIGLSGVDRTKMVNYKSRDKELEVYSNTDRHGMPDPAP
ncbi:hypothetical protein ACFOPX_03345 [Helicobacter baculiformis]|uniref:Uncharacterized protein n=1 Tax=Helicobacter baculiformis TaxID=427351 RepID=A0ABV7ZGB8_9HELI|nr:hypothetical protein [Helicobacter baculiformis]